METGKEEKAKKISVTLKPDIIKMIDEMAEEWGTSRSGMITILAKLRSSHDNTEMSARIFKDN